MLAVVCIRIIVFFRFGMVNTKITPRQVKEICPVCFLELDSKEGWAEHVLSCASTMLVCKDCQVSFKKKEYLQKHMRIKHPHTDASSTPKSKSAPEEDSDSDWDIDPEVQVGETQRESEMVERENVPGPSTASDAAELIAGRVIRKRTTPSPVQTSKKVVRMQDGVGVKKPKCVDVGVQAAIEVHEQSSGTCSVGIKQLVDQATQTEGFKRHVREVVITRYHENGRRIKCVRESEEILDV